MEKHIPTPSRPMIPYISLDDFHTKDFFTQARVQKHLRKAGLLNRNGEILTQAEYDSKQTDVAIGHENQRKITDVITELVHEMEKQHWALARNYMEDIKNKVAHQVRRIEEQYRRRTQPITIQLTRDGSIEAKPNIGRTQSLVRSRSTLPQISSLNRSRSRQTSQSSNDQQSTELDSIRKDINELKNILANLNQLDTDSREDETLLRMEQLLIKLQEKQNNIEEQQRILIKKHDEEKQRIDQLYHQLKRSDHQKNPSEINKQESADSFQTSIVINELQNRILNLETKSRNLSSRLSQEAMDQAIKISEQKTIDREGVIENLIKHTNDKVKQMETQFADLSARIGKLPVPITQTDVNQMIHNQIQNLKLTQKGNRQHQNIQPETNNKVNQLENRLNHIEQSIQNYITRSTVEQLIQQTQLTPQTNINFDQRLNQLEQQLNTITQTPDLNLINQRLIQLENRSHNTNNHHNIIPQNQIKDNSKDIQSLQQQISKLVDEIKYRSEQQLEDHLNKVSGLLKTKPDVVLINELIQQSEGRTNQQLNILQEFVNENKRALRKMQVYLNQKLNHQVKEEPKKTTTEDFSVDRLTSKELQAVMPFIELLPTFDMLYENEWN